MFPCLEYEIDTEPIINQNGTGSRANVAQRVFYAVKINFLWEDLWNKMAEKFHHYDFYHGTRCPSHNEE